MASGGAAYIPTGRSLAISRQPFSLLYAAFAAPCLYPGLDLLIMLVGPVVAVLRRRMRTFGVLPFTRRPLRSLRRSGCCFSLVARITKIVRTRLRRTQAPHVEISFFTYLFAASTPFALLFATALFNPREMNTILLLADIKTWYIWLCDPKGFPQRCAPSEPAVFLKSYSHTALS